MSADSFYVRIVRTTDDGSITYKGPMPRPRANREAEEWTRSFPTYRVDVLGVNAETRRMVRIWSRCVARGDRYYAAADWREEMRETVSTR